MSRRQVNDDDIEKILRELEDGNVSEDGLEDEDDDEENFYANAQQLVQDLVSDDMEDLVPESEDPIPHDEDDPPLVQDADPGPSSGASIFNSFDKRQIIWKTGSMTFDESKIIHEPTSTLDTAIADLDTPYKCFLHNFTPDFLEKIHFQSVRSHWHDKFGYPPIKATLSINRFEAIRSVLHFNNNEHHLPKEHPDHDRLHNIRPVIDHLNKTFSSIPVDQRLSIDEKMCATKISHFLKKYLPNKPHKWGYKLFVLCSLMGYAYRFEVYSGQDNNKDKPADEPDLGITNNVVLRLVRVVPRKLNHVIYFDNFYTSLPLAYYLSKQGIHCVGTVQQNRLPNCRLPDKNTLMKTSVPRGTYEEKVAHHDGVDFSATVWKENKVVTLLSTYVGAEPAGKVQRFDKKLKQKIDVPCPKVVQEYNMHMGGVDLMDSYLGRYRIKVKSKKWYMRLFYHLLDLAVINSWVLFKKNMSAKGIPKKQLPNLGEFRNELADALCNVGTSNGNKRGRPSNNFLEELAKKRRGPAHPLPCKDNVIGTRRKDIIITEQDVSVPEAANRSKRYKVRARGFST
ncbi:piggyBac transposable element-derived protein 3-like [Spodoptera frugiperda]|uniref:PiggyBac transposable element-derived protein 3-like n=1 Tax=Spodoptera frugiperda TaxID=7108 RepID=A0A9R0DTD1_SPOFR|nr:piggyBac transposable element-derived protein 3-like [Spodoptera frugiperda]